MVRRDFLVGILAGVMISGCAGLAWNYKWYGLDAVSYDGTLLGPSAQEDLSLKVCDPTQEPKKRGKCVVMLKAEFERLQMDWEVQKKQLEECQKNCKPLLQLK